MTKLNNKYFFGIFLVLIIFLGIFIYSQNFENKTTDLSGQQDKLTPTPSAEFTPPENYELATLNIPELGLSLSYPDFFQRADYHVVPGETGQALYGVMQVSSEQLSPAIPISAITKNFSASRGGNPTIGYVKRDNNYYLISLGGREELIDYRVEEINTVNTTGIILHGDDRVAGPGTIGPNGQRAILNLNGKFGALILEGSSKTIPDEILKEIFQSVKLD